MRPSALGAIALAMAMLNGCAGPGSTASPGPTRFAPASYPAVTPEPGDAFAELLWEYAGRGDPAASPIDRMWANYLGDEYTSPRAVVPYQPGEAPPIACRDDLTVDRWRDYAAYCRADQTIAYDAAFVRTFHDAVAPEAALAILAHEWGHHVQQTTKRGDWDIQDELQADCYAGLFASSEELAGRAEPQSLDSVARAFYELGNEEYANSQWFVSDEHGSQFQRFSAWGIGYTLLELGAPICGGYDAWRPGQTVDVGTFRVLEIPGRKGVLEGERYHLEGTELPVFDIEYVDLTAGDGATPEEQLASLLAERFGTRLGRVLGPFDFAPDPDLTAWYHYSADLDSAGQTYAQHGVMGLVTSPADPEHGLLVTAQAEGSAPVADDAPPEVLSAARAATQVALLLIERTCAPHQHAAAGQDPAAYNHYCQPDL